MPREAKSSPSDLAKFKRNNARRNADPKYVEQQRAWNKAWREKNAQTPEYRARKNADIRAYRNDPELRVRHNARQMVRHAIDSGKIVRQSCEVCGYFPAHGHHDDYSKPLDVRWLCPAHHTEHHVNERRKAKASSKGPDPASCEKPSPERTIR